MVRGCSGAEVSVASQLWLLSLDLSSALMAHCQLSYGPSLSSPPAPQEGAGGTGHYPAPTFTVISDHFADRQHLFRLPPPCQPTAILLLGSWAVLFGLFFDVGHFKVPKEHTK